MFKLLLAVISLAISVTSINLDELKTSEDDAKKIVVEDNDINVDKKTSEDEEIIEDQAAAEDKKTEENIKEIDIQAPDSKVNNSTVIINCVDSIGNPVEGVEMSICTDTMCEMRTSKADGLITFERHEDNYSVHITSYPDGYSPERKNYNIEKDDSSITITFN